jgi:glycerol-3-phosphate acyltransferase PlsY
MMLIIAFYGGYLIGSIPFGILLARLFGLGDLRRVGSGNIGATNVLRTGNKGAAALTLLFDALKGAVPVWLAWWYTASADVAAIAALGAVIGHCFPVWLGFRGGKGVATFLGALLAFSWVAFLVFAVAWLGTAAVTRYSSLAALVASLVALGVILLTGAGGIVAAVAMVALVALVIARHHQNIARLRAGTESRIGQKT